MLLAGLALVAVLPGGTTVGCPRHLPDIGGRLHPLDPEAGTETSSRPDIVDESPPSDAERFALRLVQSPIVTEEPTSASKVGLSA